MVCLDDGKLTCVAPPGPPGQSVPVVLQNDNGALYSAAAIAQSGTNNSLVLVQDGDDNQDFDQGQAAPQWSSPHGKPPFGSSRGADGRAAGGVDGRYFSLPRKR